MQSLCLGKCLVCEKYFIYSNYIHYNKEVNSHIFNKHGDEPLDKLLVKTL